MPTSSTDAARGGEIAIVFVDEAGRLGRWLLADSQGVVGRGNVAAGLPAAARIVLAVPGEQVSVHWRALDEGLTTAQVAAAARLMLADASAEPLSAMHVAVGRAEAGKTPIALVPAERVAAWLAAATAAGLDPDSIVPTPMLLAPPETGFVRRDRENIADYRGRAAAFSLEPDLAAAILADECVESIDEPAFESAVGPLAAAPTLDLRQGPFARRRPWRLDDRRLRRIVLASIALALLTLAVQVATILSYTFAADRAQAEADALARGRGAAGPGFGAGASVLFEAVRATPNVELARLEYRPDGLLVATVITDSAATLAALQGRIEASGLTVEPGQRSNAGGRTAIDLRMRAG